MRASICMCQPTKPPVVIYTRNCAAESLGSNATCAGMTGAGRSLSPPDQQRPSHIEDRKQVGHWEGDTVINAAHKQAIVTLVERKSGFVELTKVPNKSADLVAELLNPSSSP